MKAARFYADCEGHIDNPAMKQALEELQFYRTDGGINALGSYQQTAVETYLVYTGKKAEKLVYTVHIQCIIWAGVGWTNGQGDQARSEKAATVCIIGSSISCFTT